MHNGNLLKCKGQASYTAAGAKLLKVKTNIFKGSKKAHDNSTDILENDMAKILVNTFRPGICNGIFPQSKYKTSKNSPERSQERSTNGHLRSNKETNQSANNNSITHDALEMRNFSGDRKYPPQMMIQNYVSIHLNSNKSTIHTIQNSSKLKEITEETSDVESLMRKKILKKKEKIRANLLNYTNPYSTKYIQLTNCLQLGTSSVNRQIHSSLKKGDLNEKGDSGNNNHKLSVSKVEEEGISSNVQKKISHQEDILFNKFFEIFDKNIKKDSVNTSISPDCKLKNEMGNPSDANCRTLVTGKLSPDIVVNNPQSGDINSKKGIVGKTSNDMSSIVSNVSSTIVSQNQSLNSVSKNFHNVNIKKKNKLNYSNFIGCQWENTHREQAKNPCKTSINTKNNSRTNSNEKNVLKNSKNLFLNANKNSLKAASNASTNNSSSTLLNQNINSSNLVNLNLEKEGGKGNNISYVANKNLNSILGIDPKRIGNKPECKMKSNVLQNKGNPDNPGILASNMAKNILYSNSCVSYYNYHNNKPKYSKNASLNLSSNMSKKRDDVEKDLAIYGPIKSAGPISVPITCGQSKNNSKSISRIEDIVDSSTPLVMNNYSKEIAAAKSGMFNSLTKRYIPLSAAHSPTNIPAKGLLQNFIKKKSSVEPVTRKVTGSLCENNIQQNGKNSNMKIYLDIQGIMKKESIKEVAKDKSSNRQKQDQMNPLLDGNFENILEDSSDSLKSTMRESNYYKMEMEKLTNYIKQYFAIHGEYPKTSGKFYKYGRLLGRGAFGKVNIALHVLTGRLVAIKSFNKSKIRSDHARMKLIHETQILKNLRHHSIVPIYETFETKKYIIIVMEYICGGDMLSFLRKRSKLNESTAKFIFRQIIEGLQYIHSQNTVHRDIKLDNILIDLQNDVKICDFGVSKRIKKGDIMHDQCGTPAYIAPEILKNQGYEGFSVDIWSSGVVLYAMLSGTVPFKANNMNDLHRLILKGTYQTISEISDEANDLLSNLLEIDPKKRYTIDQILNHSWLRSVDLRNKSKMNLFTAAEKILLAKINVDYRYANKDDLIEHFTLRNLDTLQETENQNINTKSIILAPYNSSMKNNGSIFHQDLQIHNEVLKFYGKPKESNRNYELNNNGEIDNGIIISPQDGNTREEYNNIGTPYGLSPFSNSINNKISKPISPVGELEDKKGCSASSRDKDEHMLVKNCNSLHLSNSQMPLDEKIIQEVEELGYNKDYVIKCLLNNEINYATTSYYLLLKMHDYAD